MVIPERRASVAALTADDRRCRGSRPWVYAPARALFEACDFPVIVRPLGSHGGHDLDKISNPADLASYLARVDEPEFYLSPFIDYSGPDGQFALSVRDAAGAVLVVRAGGFAESRTPLASVSEAVMSEARLFPS